MITSTKQPRQRTNQVFDLRSFDDFIKQELGKHIPFRIEETLSLGFLPGIYQTLASELSLYKGKFYSSATFSTNAFRQAYQFEDRLEIIDELICELRNRLCIHLNTNYLKYGIRITFVTHNQWMISYLQEEQ